MSTALEISRTHLQRLLLMVEQSNWLDHPQQYQQLHEWEPSNQQHIITVISKGWGRKLVTETVSIRDTQLVMVYLNAASGTTQKSNIDVSRWCGPHLWYQGHMFVAFAKKIQQISSTKSSNGTFWRNPPNLQFPGSLTAGGSQNDRPWKRWLIYSHFFGYLYVRCLGCKPSKFQPKGHSCVRMETSERIHPLIQKGDHGFLVTTRCQKRILSHDFFKAQPQKKAPRNISSPMVKFSMEMFISTIVISHVVSAKKLFSFGSPILKTTNPWRHQDDLSRQHPGN